jgi:16S rRNA (uracil1498-N3)-methyltransferase
MKQIQHFIVNQNIAGKNLVITDKETIHQMQNVLRFRVGEECVILDGKGAKADGTIEEINRKTLSISLKNHEKFVEEKIKIRLFVALPKKPATFEMILQKATEMGVHEITPIISERTQIQEIRKLDRMNLIIKEASEQCERIFLPQLNDEIKFTDFVKNLPDGLTLAGDAWNYDEELRKINFRNQNLNLVIGPEGGLSDSELDTLRKAGAKIFLLGKNVLRMETAVIAALSVVLYG